MPFGLVWLGGLLVGAVGFLVFLFIRKQKPAEPPHVL